MEEPIFEEGDRVFAFGNEDDVGTIVRETSKRIFLVCFDDGTKEEMDYMELCLVGS